MHFRSNKKYGNEISLHEPIGADHDGNEVSLLDLVEGDEKGVDEAVADKLLSDVLRSGINEVLTDRERDIIARRYGLNGGKEYTQIEIARDMGISRSYVSRIEKKAVEKLRERLKNNLP